MSKKVLAIFFSQSGQLGEIIDNFTTPLTQSGATVEIVRVHPKSEYPFPWKGDTFFSQMPDCVLGKQTELEQFSLQESKYDLIILGYQAWFLSPSIPVNSLLSTPEFQAVLKDTPVITITGARNMWISAFERIRNMLVKAGANLVGNIALVDRHHNFVSFITIFYWMGTGKKGRFLNIFPKPGVADEDIRHTSEFGMIASKHLETGNWDNLQQELVDQKAVEIKYRLMYIESKASKIFNIWANIIVKRKNRGPWLQLFKYYLIIALFFAAPIILTFDAIFIKPFSSRKIREKKLYYLGLN
jgi:hypothetical protein